MGISEGRFGFSWLVKEGKVCGVGNPATKSNNIPINYCREGYAVSPTLTTKKNAYLLLLLLQLLLLPLEVAAALVVVIV